MAKRLNPELIDDDNPEWTVQEIARARPACDVLPKVFSSSVVKDLLQPSRFHPAEVVKAREQ